MLKLASSVTSSIRASLTCQSVLTDTGAVVAQVEVEQFAKATSAGPGKKRSRKLAAAQKRQKSQEGSAAEVADRQVEDDDDDDDEIDLEEIQRLSGRHNDDDDEENEAIEEEGSSDGVQPKLEQTGVENGTERDEADEDFLLAEMEAREMQCDSEEEAGQGRTEGGGEQLLFPMRQKVARAQGADSARGGNDESASGGQPKRAPNKKTKRLARRAAEAAAVTAAGGTAADAVGAGGSGSHPARQLKKRGKKRKIVTTMEDA